MQGGMGGGGQASVELSSGGGSWCVDDCRCVGHHAVAGAVPALRFFRLLRRTSALIKLKIRFDVSLRLLLVGVSGLAVLRFYSALERKIPNHPSFLSPFLSQKSL